MKYQKGFTVVELLAAVILLLAAGSLVLIQKRELEVMHDDTQRKTSINAIHHHLEKIYYPANNHYPEALDKETLPGLEPSLLVGPSGNQIGDTGSSLRYEPIGCNDGKCRGYTLRADLDKEADYVKQSQSTN